MLTNTDKFRQPAIHFEEHGVYTNYPRTSKSYYNFWKEEKRRCIEGFEAPDGSFISGYFYFYLNYCPIYVTVPKKDLKGNILFNEEGQQSTDRVKKFPRFWDGDYDYFAYLENCEKEGKHASVLKTRGRGYSFKGASMCNRNFFLIPGSKSYVIADQKTFLGGEDGILSKAWEQMGHINEHTAFSKKMHFHNTDMHKRASYKSSQNGVDQEKGYMSDIIGVTLKNDPNRARGKRGRLILFEEAGKMPSLLQAWQIAIPSVQQGKDTFGLMVAFGTGGTEGADFDGLSELFDNPKGYNILPVNNIWDKNLEGTQCGFFMPEYMNLEGFYDKDGNSDIQGALVAIEKDRKIIRDFTKDKNAYKRYVAEKPINTIEARMKLSGNIFPTVDLLGVLAKLESDPNYEQTIMKGNLQIDPAGDIVFIEDPNARAIYNFPTKKEDDSDAPVILYAPPVRMSDGTIPAGLYIAGIDPYDHDQASTNSLGSTLIMNKLTNEIVAEYSARPNLAKEYYEQVRRLLMFYNARALFENERKGIMDYFEYKKSLHLLCEEPLLVRDMIKTPSASRRLGLKMSEQVKRWGEAQISSWLQEINDTESFKLNLHKIRSIPLLKELAAYDPDPKKNFDRAMALMCLLYQAREEISYVPTVDDKPKFIPFHQRGFFGRGLHRPPMATPR